MSRRLTTKQAPPGEGPPKVTRRLQGKQAASRAAIEAPPEEAAPDAIAPSKHDAMLRKIYYDVEEGFGSIDKVYKEAKKKDPTITKKSLKKFCIDKPCGKRRKIPYGIHGWLTEH